MIRALIPAAAVALLAALPALAQEADPGVTARYVADFTRLCLDTGGERAAVRAAAAEGGWTVGAPPAEVASAVDLAVFDSPDGRGGRLLTSASSPGELDGGLIVRTCILQPPDGDAGPRERLVEVATRAMGLPGTPTPGGVVWLASGTRATGFVDERANFAAADTPDAGFALALQRPLLMLTVVGDERQAGLALLRVSPE